MWYREGWIYRILGIINCLVIERSLYDAFFCANFLGDGYAGTDTLRTDAVSETTFGYGTGWGATTVYCGFNSDGNSG